MTQILELIYNQFIFKRETDIPAFYNSALNWNIVGKLNSMEMYARMYPKKKEKKAFTTPQNWKRFEISTKLWVLHEINVLIGLN